MNRKRILLPIWYEYYIFEYYLELSKELKLKGYEVDLITSDIVLYKKFTNAGLNSRYAPFLIRLFLKRSGNIFIRTLLWLSGYIWVSIIRRQYDFSILPWDNKPLWYIIQKKIPSMMIHNCTNLMDIEQEYNEHGAKKKHKVAEYLERIFNIKLLPRLNGIILRHNYFWYLDRLLGLRSENLLIGFSGIGLLTVTGNKIKENLIKLGLPKKTKISVVGNPSYDNFIEYSIKFTHQNKRDFKKALNLNEDEEMFSLFLSPSSFSDTMIEEIEVVVNAVLFHNPNASICIKFHPKTEAKFYEIFDNFISQKTVNYKLITSFNGDLFNLDMILSSKCILLKQGTIAFIAMLVSAPIISYNLRDTFYHDDMMKTMKASFHSLSFEDILINLDKLNITSEMKKLERLQVAACDKFCVRTSSSKSQIIEVIDDYFL